MVKENRWGYILLTVTTFLNSLSLAILVWLKLLGE